MAQPCKQVKTASDEIIRICKNAVKNKDKWPYLADQLQKEIKKQDYFFKLERILDGSD